jgi:Ni/Fe-hydrogenase subunit HybB-like protein
VDRLGGAVETLATFAMVALVITVVVALLKLFSIDRTLKEIHQELQGRKS